MAVRISSGTGNFTTAGTWGLVDSTSYLNAETGSEVLTTAYSATRSSAFTPGAITIDGIAVKLSVRTGTTGTMSVELFNNSLSSAVSATEVTINTADLQAATTAGLDGGWIFFKFASSVLLLAATSYSVEAKTSSATQISLFRDATTDNIARALRTTTTGAPAAGDDLIVIGEYTGAGTSNSLTVTMDNTATTDFGANSNSLVTPALSVGAKGTLTWGTAASTNYYYKISGNMIVYNGGTWNRGTSGTRVPSTSTAKIEFDCVANVDYGFTARNGAIVNEYGATITTTRTLLTADVSAAGTVLTLASTSGWSTNDQLAIAATTRTSAESEKKTVSTVDSGTQVTLTAGVTNAHSGTSPTQGEVGNLTRNVSSFGTSATLQGFYRFDTTSTVNIDYCEYYQMGSATANKGGIDILTTTGSCSITNSSLHDSTVASSKGFNISGTAANNITISNNVVYNIAANLFAINSPTTGTSITVDNNYFIYNSGSSNTVNLLDVGITFTNNSVVAGLHPSPGATIYLAEVSTSIGTFSGNSCHSGNRDGIYFSQDGLSGTISNCKIWRETVNGINPVNCADIIFSNCTLFGNGTANVNYTGTLAGQIQFNNCVFDAGATLTSPVGLLIANGVGKILMSSTTFGATTTHSTGDISISTSGITVNIVANNCLFGSSTEIANQSNLSASSIIGSSKHDQTSGNHKAFKRYGTLSIDTTIFDTSPSQRLTPSDASNDLQSSPWQVAINSGQSLTCTVKVRESVVGDGTDYNGNRIKLYVRRNDSIGITSDTLLATATVASEGAFETISGATASATDDGVAEFYCTASSSSGWVNIDTITVT